jgi:gamma-glutamyltranspeptidase/glutathione hydrolase
LAVASARGLNRQHAMPQLGWKAETVPGAVAPWAKLVHRFGRLKLAEVAAPAIAVTPIIATLWRRPI